jgi:hypothetical protein
MNAMVKPILSILVWLCSLLFLQASVEVGPLTNNSNGHLYYVLSQQSWSNAQAEAQSLGGHLATIRSVAENNWMMTNVLIDFTSTGGPDLTAEPLCIGLIDTNFNDGGGAQHAADFFWIDGETNTYRDWNPGEPNNNNNGEYWGSINWDYAAGYGAQGTWNDVPDSGTTGYPGNSTGPYYGLMEIGTGLGPTLVISLAGPQTVLVQWPVGPYTLQQNPNLLTTTWVASTFSVSTSNGTNGITVSPATNALCFRLSVQ